MCAAAIAKRIRDVGELMRLGRSLSRAKYVGTVKERRPDWSPGRPMEKSGNDTSIRLERKAITMEARRFIGLYVLTAVTYGIVDD